MSKNFKHEKRASPSLFNRKTYRTVSIEGAKKSGVKLKKNYPEGTKFVIAQKLKSGNFCIIEVLHPK